MNKKPPTISKIDLGKTHVRLHDVALQILTKITLCSFNSSTGYTEEVTPFSKICLVCPNPATITRETNQNIEKDRMFENMWIVDKHSYDTCTINQSIASNKLLLNCDTPSSLTYYTIVFQIFSPTTNEVLFQPGETYYIICKYERNVLGTQVVCKNKRLEKSLTRPGPCRNSF